MVKPTIGVQVVICHNNGEIK